MKRIVSALAAAALLVTPLTAAAQGHGGFGHGGGGFSHGGFGRGGFASPQSFGGFHGGGFGFRRGFFPFFGFGLGFALAADPWFYGYPGYWWDYGPPYGYYGYPYGPPPPPGATTTAPPAACGSWIWHADQGRYQWVAAPCAAPAPPPAEH